MQWRLPSLLAARMAEGALALQERRRKAIRSSVACPMSCPPPREGHHAADISAEMTPLMVGAPTVTGSRQGTDNPADERSPCRH